MVDPSKYARGTIVERQDYSSDLWSIRIQSDTPFSFTPGQYATLGVERDGQVVERPYSIVSSPHEAQLEFFFELVPDGLLTPLLQPLAVGAEVLLRKRPKGVFTFDTASGHKKHLFICTVTGVAPYVSMVRTFLRELRDGKLPTPPSLMILEGASRSWEMGYRSELDAAARELPGMHHIATISRPWEDTEWTGERGRVEDVLRKYADELGVSPEDTTVYLCGHPGMIENARAIMVRRGFGRHLIHEEQYWPPGKASGE